MINNQKGFSLIQVMVAGTIMSLLSLSMASLIADQRTATAQLEDQLEKVQLIRSIESVLGDSLSCQNSLSGVSIPANGGSVNVPSLRDTVGNALVSSNAVEGNLMVGQIILRNSSVGSGVSSGFVDIMVPISRVRKGGGPAEMKPIETRVNVSVNAARNVVGCTGNSVNFNVLNAGVIPPSTPQTGVALAAAQPGVICFLAGVDDDSTRAVNFSSAGYYEHKCRVGYNATRSHWHGWAPLTGGEVSCSFLCLRASIN